MNYSLGIFLISDAVRAIMATYEMDSANSQADRTMFKTLDQSIKVGDYVVVETDTRHHMTVCKIIETDDVEPDFNSTKEVKWIIGTVARADFDALKVEEADAIARIKSAEKRKKRDELRKDLIADANGGLKASPIYTLEDRTETKAE